MSQLLTVSRAAHLIGVTRADLQKHIASGDLPSHDGMVFDRGLAERLFPEVRLEDSGAFERITKIREEAFGRRVRERVLPNQEVLAQRLAAQSEELEDVRRHLAHYHDLIEALRERIEGMAHASASEQLADLGEFLDSGLAGVLGQRRTIRHAGGNGRYAERHVGTCDGQAFGPRILCRGQRNDAQGVAARRPGAVLRLRQRQLRAVQGARRLRPVEAGASHRLSAVGQRAHPGLCAALLAHGGVRPGDRDAGGHIACRHSRAGDRRQGA